MFYLGLTALIFLRSPSTNFIFDEQEALLANPYLWGELPFHRVLEVDFWGRSPSRTIGSYRPLPNLLWRSLAWSLKYNTPWLLTLWNLLAHALTASFLVRAFVGALSQGHVRHEHSLGGFSLSRHGAWILGVLFTTNAVSSEAVCGVVGLADLLVGLFAAICLWCLVWIRSKIRLAVALFCAGFLGCLSKETMLSVLPLLALLTLLLPSLNPELGFGNSPRPSLCWKVSGARSLVVGAAVVSAQVAAAVLRKRFFPTPSRASESTLGLGARGVDAIVQWWALPPWPVDELNNPTLLVGTSERIATAAAIYVEQLFQFVAPFELVGDYSAPRQAVHNWDALALFGTFLFCLSCVWALWTAARQNATCAARSGLATSILWVNLCFLPVSGAIVVLPTIRAERLFYPASLGAALGLLFLLASFWRWAVLVASRPRHPLGTHAKKFVVAVFVVFVFFQAARARYHAFDYSSDLAFWEATNSGENASAKSFLNLGIMRGARGDLDARLVMTSLALKAAPDWAMGKIYLADTYCRRDELALARPHYLEGLKASPHSKSLTALSLQCIWDHGKFEEWREDLKQLAEQHPDSWLDYFVYEIEHRGAENDGISAEHRARHYNRPSGLPSSENQH